jgi:hypothetical protein
MSQVNADFRVEAEEIVDLGDHVLRIAPGCHGFGDTVGTRTRADDPDLALAREAPTGIEPV